MLKINDYALISGHVYTPKKETYHGIKFGFFSELNKTDLQSNSWNRAIDVDLHMVPSRHFYCQLYMKFHQGKPSHAVVAVRGTQNLHNIMIDVKSFYSDVMGTGEHGRWPAAYMSEAYAFLHKARFYVKKHFPAVYAKNQLRVTGHSLGGAIAKLLSLTDLPFRAVAFNAPGCANIPEVYTNRFPLIYNINARFGIINKVGQSAGNLYYISVPNNEEEAYALYENFNNKEHEWAVKQFKMIKRVDPYHTPIGDMPRLAASLEELHSYLAGSDAMLDAKGDKACDKKHLLFSSSNNYLSFFMMKLGYCIFDRDLTLGKTIFAQHTIENLIPALYSPDNQAIGNLFV